MYVAGPSSNNSKRKTRDGLHASKPAAPLRRTCTMKGGVGETGLRGAIGDERQNVAHVHGVGLQVRVGQAVGLLAFQHRLIVIHKENASLHADQVAQVGGRVIQAVRVFRGQRGRVEVCKTGRVVTLTSCTLSALLVCLYLQITVLTAWVTEDTPVCLCCQLFSQ